MTPQQLGAKMVGALPDVMYPLALLAIDLKGTRLELIIPHIYQRMLQDPRERETIIQFFREQLETMGKHPEDWNGRVRVIES